MVPLLQRSQPVLFVLVASWIASSATALASEPGGVAAALVLETSYRHFLDDMLYTHDGDDRCWGPEHDLAQDNITAILASYGLDVALEPFPYESDTYYNVVATKRGTTYPNQEYIIGAHFDSMNTAGGEGAPGAGDNASGVALVLEAARVLSAYDSDYTIRFIAFDREGQGVIGSSAYVLAHADDTILGIITPDMIVSGGSQEVIIHGGPASETFRDAVGAAVTTYGQGLLPALRSDFSPCGNDHCPFQDAGIPGCRLLEYEYASNPYDHTSQDSVDRRDYIDYAYATRITRSIVGFLVDYAGVQVPVPDADYDGDGDVDQDDFDEFSACYAGSGVPPAPGCAFFDLDADGDVDCRDADLFGAVWTGGGDPPPIWPCIRLPAVAENAGGRCISVTPPAHGLPLALRVMGDPDDASVSCLDAYVQTDGRLMENSPVFRTYDAWGTVDVCDQAIVGGTYYQVRCDYGEPGSPVLSAATSVTTALWGDAVGDFVSGAWTAPDGVIDFNDITSIVDAFRQLPSAPAVSLADLVGSTSARCRPQGVVDFDDISAAVDAFRSLTYWASTGCPPPCN